MKIEYKFDIKELKLICQCLEVAKDKIIDTSGNDFYNIIKLRENLVRIINIDLDLNELE